MKLPRRRPTRKAKMPNNLAIQFLELQKLRAEVFRAELAVAQKVTTAGEAEVYPQQAKTKPPVDERIGLGPRAALKKKPNNPDGD